MPNFGTVLTIIDLDGTAHKVTRSGLLFAYGDKSTGLPLTLLHDAARIPDFGGNLKRPAAIMARVRQMDYDFETRHDAAHGRRYALCCYSGRPFTAKRNAQRRVVLAAMDGIENLRAYQIDCGIPADEIDALMQKEKSNG